MKRFDYLFDGDYINSFDTLEDALKNLAHDLKAWEEDKEDNPDLYDEGATFPFELCNIMENVYNSSDDLAKAVEFVKNAL